LETKWGEDIKTQEFSVAKLDDRGVGEVHKILFLLSQGEKPGQMRKNLFRVARNRGERGPIKSRKPDWGRRNTSHTISTKKVNGKKGKQRSEQNLKSSNHRRQRGGKKGGRKIRGIKTGTNFA